MAVIKNW